MAVRSSFGSRPITFKKSLRATRTTGWFGLPSGAGRPAPVYEYVDTHTHLDAIYARLRRQLDWPFAELARSFSPGFAGCVTLPIGTSFDATMDFIERGSPLVYGAVGLHPHHAKHWDSAVEARLRALLQHPRVLALGETGLDYYRCLSPPDVQRGVFAGQCELAVALKRPIVVHTRNASADTAAILDRYVPRDHKVHIHCYTDDYWFCQELLAARPNAYFGVTGAATFAFALNVHTLCRKVPLNRILAESDGPYMAPAPFIGEVATPGHIPLVVRAIAELKSIDEATAFATIRQNCREFYGF